MIPPPWFLIKIPPTWVQDACAELHKLVACVCVCACALCMCLLVHPNCSIYEAPIGTPSPSASIRRIAGIEIKPVVDAVDTWKDLHHSIWHAAREPKRSQAGKTHCTQTYWNTIRLFRIKVGDCYRHDMHTHTIKSIGIISFHDTMLFRSVQPTRNWNRPNWTTWLCILSVRCMECPPKNIWNVGE